MDKILIANRGEIALRVMRTCREMGIGTVAVFSEADRKAPFVRYADEAVCIGPPESSNSYLRGDKIIEVAKMTKTDGIHPGYGFLAENASFAEAVTRAGIIFIGPSAQAMRMMGDKLSSKEVAKKNHIPMVPGSTGAVEDSVKALAIAQKIHFPVLIKASAGGGGKGMRIVENKEVLEEQMKRASSEAKAAFGDGAVFIEKYIKSPRHIEIQVLADNYGNVVHLVERECSIQRRHQKVIEEAPSSLLTPDVRRKMGEYAVTLCKACSYTGAGTVEFLADEELNFYFLEMNTRLQVEHPVTELITGIDLVREQINIAKGEKLHFNQKDIAIKGHAIEIRVCAEDAGNNFLPDTGTLHVYRRPSGPGVRMDDGCEEGMEIPIFYDSLLAKLIVHSDTRPNAIQRMIRAIDEFRISGIHTTLEFCKLVLQHNAFTSGKFDTRFIEKYFNPEVLRDVNCTEDERIVTAIAALLFRKEDASVPVNVTPVNDISSWRNRRNAD